MTLSGVLMWFKVIERLAYHGLLQLIIPGFQPVLRSITLVSLMAGLILEYRYQTKKPDDKRLLQDLNRLLSLIESGNSPRYSFEQVKITDYPDYLSHPLDTYFNPAIFKRQVGLFEKSVLIQAELEAEFAVIGYRMMIMKFLPLLLMIGLQQIVTLEVGSTVTGWIVNGFLFSYYLSERLSRS